LEKRSEKIQAEINQTGGERVVNTLSANMERYKEDRLSAIEVGRCIPGRLGSGNMGKGEERKNPVLKYAGSGRRVWGKNSRDK